MDKISKDEATIIAGKVNDLIMKSYVNDTIIMIDDIVKLTDLTEEKSKRILDELVKKKILSKSNEGGYCPNPKLIEKFKEAMEKAHKESDKVI